MQQALKPGQFTRATPCCTSESVPRAVLLAQHSETQHSRATGVLADMDDVEAVLAACAVAMNGEPLAMTKGETELELLPFVEGGELLVLWQKHRENMGEAIEITTSEPHLL